MYTLTFRVNGSFRFVWGFDNKYEAIRQAVKTLRRHNSGSVEITRGDDVIWSR